MRIRTGIRKNYHTDAEPQQEKDKSVSVQAQLALSAARKMRA